MWLWRAAELCFSLEEEHSKGRYSGRVRIASEKSILRKPDFFALAVFYRSAEHHVV
jgi:hypothetical protein